MSIDCQPKWSWNMYNHLKINLDPKNCAQIKNLPNSNLKYRARLKMGLRNFLKEHNVTLGVKMAAY